MSFFTVGWQPPANIGWLPQHPGDGTEPFFSVGWVPKQSATWYPYDPAELDVAPGVPDAPPATEPSPGSGVPLPAPAPLPSPVIRAHVAHAYVAARKSPALYRREGLAIQLDLEAPARVTAVVVAASGKRKLTFSQERSLSAGSHRLRLRASEYGRMLTLHHKRVAARLEVTIAYADKSKGAVTRSVVLEAPAKSK